MCLKFQGNLTKRVCGLGVNSEWNMNRGEGIPASLSTLLNFPWRS